MSCEISRDEEDEEEATAAECDLLGPLLLRERDNVLLVALGFPPSSMWFSSSVGEPGEAEPSWFIEFEAATREGAATVNVMFNDPGAISTRAVNKSHFSSENSCTCGIRLRAVDILVQYKYSCIVVKLKLK